MVHCGCQNYFTVCYPVQKLSLTKMCPLHKIWSDWLSSMRQKKKSADLSLNLSMKKDKQDELHKVWKQLEKQ